MNLTNKLGVIQIKRMERNTYMAKINLDSVDFGADFDIPVLYGV